MKVLAIDEKREKHRIYKRLLLAGAVCLIACTWLVQAVIHKMTDVYFQDMTNSMTATVMHDQRILKERIAAEYLGMDAIAGHISRAGIENYDYDQSVIEKQMNMAGYKQMGVIAKSGKIVYGPGLKDFSIPGLSDAMNGTPTIRYVKNSPFDEENSLVVYYPIKNEVNEVEGVLYGVADMNTVCNLFDNIGYDGQSEIFVVDRQGNMLVPPRDQNRREQINLLFKNWLIDDEKEEYGNSRVQISQMMEEVATGDVGHGLLDMPDGSTMYMAVMSVLGSNEIYLVNGVAGALVTTRISNMVDTIGCVLIISLILGFGFAFHKEYMDYVHARRIREMAFLDKLTGLGNMAQLKNDIFDILEDDDGISDSPYAMVSIDINKLKTINEAMGFYYGTELIKDVGSRLSDYVDEGERCYRNGNDLFYMLLFSRGQAGDEKRIRTMLDEMTEYYQESFGHQLTFSAGINPVKFKELKRDEITSIFDNADMARKNNKGQTRNTVSYFDEQIIQQLKEEREMEDAFLPAIANGEFVMYFQPKYKVVDGEPTLGGAEALVRWISSVHGFMPPGKFLPLFERDGNAATLDMHVMELVCRQINKWRQDGFEVVPISVNVCRQTLIRGKDFMKEVDSLLHAYEIPRDLIQLEVLESATGENEDLMVDLLNDMHHKGFKIAMDDFGRGHSSLGMIQKMPLDYLKLDKSFFDKWTENPENKTKEASLVQRTIQLAKDMDMVVVAEGIEEKFQVDRLVEFGCDMIQGYYFSKPLPASEFEQKMSK